MCLNETYSRVWVDEHLSDMFLIQNGPITGDALLSVLFNFAFEYAIRGVEVNQDGLKLNCTYQLLVYADDVNMWGGRVLDIERNAEALIIASPEIGLRVYLIKLSRWSCLEIRMQEQITI